MKIIYEQGDIVYNLNNKRYGIVIKNHESTDSASILESGGKGVFINCPPNAALKYCGHTDLTKVMKRLLWGFIDEDGDAGEDGEEVCHTHI